MRFWSEPHRPPHDLCDASDCRRHCYLEVVERGRMKGVAALAMKRGKSVDFTGYWQRHIAE
jgi:hypothetical protein